MTQIPDWYYVSLINSELISLYVDNFINNTSHFQINDARQLPVIVPNINELIFFNNLFVNEVKKKKQDFSFNSMSNQQELDTFVQKLYNI